MFKFDEGKGGENKKVESNKDGDNKHADKKDEDKSDVVEPKASNMLGCFKDSWHKRVLNLKRDYKLDDMTPEVRWWPLAVVAVNVGRPPGVLECVVAAPCTISSIFVDSVPLLADYDEEYRGLYFNNEPRILWMYRCHSLQLIRRFNICFYHRIQKVAP